MSILIVGADGNMGRRYRAIMDYLGIAWAGVDKDDGMDSTQLQAKISDGIIIATPTATHSRLIRNLSILRKPILCEKPLSKDLFDLKETIDVIRSTNTSFSMVYQYRELVGPTKQGDSHYNYFKHGNDGLVWDCIQVIGLAKGEIDLEEESPIWRCTINDRPLDIKHMDYAYVKFVRNWLKQPRDDLGMIKEIHEKTYEMALERGMNGRNH